MSPAVLSLENVVTAHTEQIRSLNEGQVRHDGAMVRLEDKVDRVLLGVAGALILGLASLAAILLTRH